MIKTPTKTEYYSCTRSRKFCVPFYVNNGVPCFQRFIDKIMLFFKLKETIITPLDGVNESYNNQEEYDSNRDQFLKIVEKCKNCTV